MNNWLERTELLLGEEKLDILRRSRVLVVGLGGVGAYAAEMIARAGVGRMTVADADTVAPSNINRQLGALSSTAGRPKAEVLAERARDINPACQVEAIRLFYLPQNADQVDLSPYNYVVDCIDTVAAKLELVTRCNALQIKIISAMGTGNKFDPSALVVTDISKTQGCPLARTVRKELRKRGIHHLKVVYSTELPTSPLRSGDYEPREPTDTRPGSTARSA